MKLIIFILSVVGVVVASKAEIFGNNRYTYIPGEGHIKSAPAWRLWGKRAGHAKDDVINTGGQWVCVINPGCDRRIVNYK